MTKGQTKRTASPVMPYEATLNILLLASFGAFCLGVSKTGFPGLTLVNVLIMAELFGAKSSVGIILPMLIVCDLIVYPLFRRFASWREVWPLVPVTLAAIVGAWFLLDHFDDLTARRVIGAIILLMLCLQLLREWRKQFLERLPDSGVFRILSCILIGFSTMLANAAGPIYSIYALVRGLSKEDFLGIGARFFLLVNLFKLPFLGQIDLVNRESLLLNAILIPALLIGIFLGKKLIHHVPQRAFEILLYAFSLIAGVRMLFF
ncbi:MAG: sulfite exporter TauE/SafE family protein [Verrucomicrobiota bacterium]